MTTYETLREYVFGLTILDTHEHLPAWEKDRDKCDVLAEYLKHYFSCDLVSAGLSPADLAVARDSSKPLMERWRLVEPFWNAARNTGYGRALDLAARDLHGLPRITGETIEPLDRSFQAARAKGDVYKAVLKEKSRIGRSILDSGTRDCDRQFFAPTTRLDDFIAVSNWQGLEELARRAGAAPIHTLTDLEDACEAAIDKDLAAGAICLKSGLAYGRPLAYPKVSRAAAEESFARLFAVVGQHNPPTSGTLPLENHMMHHVCRIADRRGLAFQVHTGLQEGNGNFIDHSDPALLTNLLLEYRNIRFDIFHIGYPFQFKLAALAKNFANVFIDFCWAHIISPSAATDALVEYLDSVPANKISGFGGDYCFIDGVYGHQYIAREDVVRALAIRVERGACDLDEARQLAKMVLHDNPARIFGFSS